MKVPRSPQQMAEGWDANDPRLDDAPDTAQQGSAGEVSNPNPRIAELEAELESVNKRFVDACKLLASTLNGASMEERVRIGEFLDEHYPPKEAELPY